MSTVNPNSRHTNPLDDLRDFAREALRRHEAIQAAGRREAANTPKLETKRTFVDFGPTRQFSNVPSRPGRSPQIVNETAGAVLTGGAFFTKYVDDATGDTYLQGGNVKSGSGNFTIADKKVLDFTTGMGTLGGHVLVLEVDVDGYAPDGVLLAGLTATAADWVSPDGTTSANDTLPTAASPSGKKVFIEIGRWADDDFFPANAGNIRISFCPGSYNITRY